MTKLVLNPDRYFSTDTAVRAIARELYQSVVSLPLVCPHGHVDPRLFAEPDATFGSPADLFIIPDHYVTRMLYSQGISLESLGVPPSPLSPLPERERGAEGGVRWNPITAKSGASSAKIFTSSAARPVASG